MDPGLVCGRGDSVEWGLGMVRRLGLALMLAGLCMGCRNADVDKGRACLGLGDYPLALRFFSRAVEADPQGYEARLGLGQALLQQAFALGDSLAFDGALLQLEACRSLRPSEDLGALLGEAWLERARGLLRGGDTLAALAALSKSRDRAPGDPKPLNLAGIIYGKRGETDKAATLFREALAQDSADASAHFNLGMLNWQDGDVRAAHGHWLASLRALPTDEDILYWFALAEKKMRESP